MNLFANTFIKATFILFLPVILVVIIVFHFISKYPFALVFILFTIKNLQNYMVFLERITYRIK